MADNDGQNQSEPKSGSNIFEKMLHSASFIVELPTSVDQGAIAGPPAYAPVVTLVNPLNSGYLASFNTDLDCETYDEVVPEAETSQNQETENRLPKIEQVVSVKPVVEGSKQVNIGPGAIPPNMEGMLRTSTSRTFNSRGRGGRRSTGSMSNMMVELKMKSVDAARMPNQVEYLTQMFPKISRIIVDRTHTSNLFDLEKTIADLTKRQEAEDEKRRNVRLVPAPRRGKPATKLEDQHAPPNLPTISGRGGFPYYRRVVMVNGQVVTAPPKIPVGQDDEVIQTYMERRCRSYVSNEVDGTLVDEGALSSYKRSYIENSVEKLAEVDWRYKEDDKPEVVELTPQEEPEVEEIDITDDEVPTQTPARPGKSEAAEGDQAVTSTPQSGNKFFRNKRLCDTELKKREYVSRELQQGFWLSSRVHNLGGYGPGVVGGGSATLPVIASVEGATGPSPSSSQFTPGSKRGRGNFRGRNRGGRGGSSIKRRRIQASPRSSDEEGGEEFLGDLKTEDVEDEESSTALQEEKMSILTFFNTSQIEELALIPMCSRKKAELIVTLRPFAETQDLIDKLDSTKPLSSDLVHSCKDVLHMRSMVIRLLQRCEKIAQKMEGRTGGLLEWVELPAGMTDPELITEQPTLLNPTLSLKPYQMVGLNWLRLIHAEQLNGILADEMGLGKTAQAIAFLAYLLEHGEKGPHLIIVPSSTLDNWKRELAMWCAPMKVLVYYGTQEERKAVRVRIYEGVDVDFNVMLTTYTVGTNSIEDRAMMKRINFHYGVFDEAHMLKNMTSQRYKNLMNFKVQRRILLTGTPLQNNLVELLSLLSFVMPDLFMRNNDLLKKMFQLYAKGSSEEDEGRGRSQFEVDRVKQAQSLLRPFCLRRLKQHVMKQLPPKTEETVRPTMPEPQCSVYWDLVDTMRSRLSSGNGETNGEESTDNTTSSGSGSTISMVSQLRKAANHPLLHRRLYSDDLLRQMAKAMLADNDHRRADPELIYQDMCVMNDFELHKTCLLYRHVLDKYILANEAITNSAKMTYLDEMLPKLKVKGDRVLLFSQFVIMLNILEEYMVLKGYSYLRLDGSTPVSERQGLIDKFNSDATITVFLLSTRAGGLGINLTGANVVLLHDIDFNPYNDRQAEDRCHRVGQEKPVRVIRLITANTVEEGMLRIATEKLKLEEDVTGVQRRKQPAKAKEDEAEEEEEEENGKEGQANPLRVLKSEVVSAADDLAVAAQVSASLDPVQARNILSEALNTAH